jgi:hypothetical protein
MRNEAIFLLEWIAYNLVMGFTTVAVATNDCTDGTDRMVKKLSRIENRIVHIPNPVKPGQSPQREGMTGALAHPRIGGAEWLLHCDSDEFLHVDRGAGRIEDFLVGFDQADCIALAWRNFGDGGMERWPGGMVLENCRLGEGRLRPHYVRHKSMFRPSVFQSAIDHMPKSPVRPDIRVVAADGTPMNPKSVFDRKASRYHENDNSVLTWTPACIHHYAFRARDVFLMKNLRGDGMARVTGKYQIKSGFWRRFNRNEVEVPAAHQHLIATRRVAEELRQASGSVRRLERKAFEAFEASRDAYLSLGGRRLSFRSARPSCP